MWQLLVTLQLQTNPSWPCFNTRNTTASSPLPGVLMSDLSIEDTAETLQGQSGKKGLFFLSWGAATHGS